METIYANSVSEALHAGLNLLRIHGIEEPSRNGPVLVAPGPVMTVYTNPVRRVLFSPKRDANPFFHFFEALWILAGRNDIAFPKLFNSKFGDYSDDGVHSPGAYGFRWLKYWKIDQLKLVVKELQRAPDSRRAVLQMWDIADLKKLEYSKDVPCNTHAYFDLRGYKLNMTVCCRSNDILWGAYGANAVHFSMLLEIMAAWLNVPVGHYRQFSNNFHFYTAMGDRSRMYELAEDALETDGVFTHFPMVRYSVEQWRANLENFFSQIPGGDLRLEYTEPFFSKVAQPMYQAWNNWKSKTGEDLLLAKKIEAHDWRLACTEWLERRHARSDKISP